MLDGLVGLSFEVRQSKAIDSRVFTVTAVEGSKASIVDADNRRSMISVWSLMRSWRESSIVVATAPPAHP